VLKDGFETEVALGKRFRFGSNWARFLERVDDGRIAEAERSLRTFLDADNLAGLRWLDVGSGSGLFSLAARRLGATVHSFDFDPDSVACTRALRQRFHPGDPGWTVERGSALDAEYMWKAIDLACTTVKPGGRLWLMIYLDEGLRSKFWRQVKRTYCSGRAGRAMVLVLCAPGLVLRSFAEDAANLRHPLERYRRPGRGMSATHDLVDWLGGYPFEVARPDQVEAFCRDRGFRLLRRRGEESLLQKA
jgi:2-polyprenyl-6-hydroxyphenyl methylase/3-demethylubiquinone-9 3-methyltransferase